MTSISVLMPMKDAERYAAKAIKSTLSALPRDGELLIFDDSSSDGSADVAERLNDGRVTLVRGKEQAGVSGALNALLQRASGTYVARMDADDICLPWRFKMGLEAAARGMVVFGRALLVDEEGALIGARLGGCRSQEAVRLELLLDNPFVHPTMLARRSLLLEHGGYATCLAEDYELWLRLAGSGVAFHTIRCPVLKYRVHGSQISSPAGVERLLRDPVLIESWRRLYEQIIGYPPAALDISSLREAWSCDWFRNSMRDKGKTSMPKLDSAWLNWRYRARLNSNARRSG